MKGLSENMLPFKRSENLKVHKACPPLQVHGHRDIEWHARTHAADLWHSQGPAHVFPPHLMVRSPYLTLKSRFPLCGKEQPSLCCGSWTCFQNSILLQSWPFQRIWYAPTFQFVSKYFFDWSSSTLTFADRIASFVCLSGFCFAFF